MRPAHVRGARTKYGSTVASGSHRRRSKNGAPSAQSRSNGDRLTANSSTPNVNKVSGRFVSEIFEGRKRRTTSRGHNDLHSSTSSVYRQSTHDFWFFSKIDSEFFGYATHE